ncbi:MAG: hypothetical protein GDA51_11290 [Ekhidna sp.]|nr:hypothetical protein [Ekhidna sp.]
MKNIKEKIVNAISNKKLNIDQEGERFWYNYKIRITKLYWTRNLFDGYQIEVYDKYSNKHLETLIY